MGLHGHQCVGSDEMLTLIRDRQCSATYLQSLLVVGAYCQVQLDTVPYGANNDIITSVVWSYG